MAHDHDVAKEIRDVIALTEPDAFPPSASVLYRLTTWACEIADAVHAVAEKWETGDLKDLEPAAIEAALAIWDDVIVPLDVPRVPEVFERILEGQIRGAIPTTIGGLFARLEG